MTNQEKVFWLVDLVNTLANPRRVKILMWARPEEDLFCLSSAHNANDTFGWFDTNSRKLEGDLRDQGYSFVYVFEPVAEDTDPCIYAFIGKNLDIETVADFCRQFQAPEAVIHFEQAPFCDVADKYRHATALENALTSSATGVIRILEP